MDALLLEQHLRSPLRLFQDPMMTQFATQENDGASAALLEKARQHLQMWGRSPYTDLLLPQMYQRPNLNAALNFGLWQGQWSPQLSAAAGFLSNQAALHQAAAVAAQQQQALSPQPISINSESPSPEIKLKHFPSRFSPYPMNHQQTSLNSQKYLDNTSSHSQKPCQPVTRPFHKDFNSHSPPSSPN